MKKLIILTAFIISAASMQADETHPFQASLTPDIAIYPKTAEIHGLSLSIWGENPQQGVALGIVNGSSGGDWSTIQNPTPVFRGPGSTLTKPASTVGNMVW
jgi:hypothetical protein